MENIFHSFIETYRNSKHPLAEETIYALHPAGKLFRPKLFKAVCDGLGISAESSLNDFALFLEVHHAYTLVHDDLPSMDDSDTRRGKDSVHKKFGEWKAVLVGDALMGLSYELLSRCRIERKFELETLCHWALGAKGLIAGQALDLALPETSYNEITRIHELKTGRLILLSTLAPYYFLNINDPSLFKKLWKLGTLLGKYFQLKDDYDDFVHEPDDSLNIFVVDEARAKEELNACEKKVTALLKDFPKVQELLKLLK